jgi:Protein of unknown function (DUF4446)
MQSLRDIAPYLALGAAVLGVVVLVLLVRVMVAQRRLRRAQLAVLGAHGERDLVTHAQDLEEQVRNLREAVRGLDGLLASHKVDLDRAFTHRAIVRYDAFRDIGGEQSASIALLDNTASGLVISMIHSRDYARIYVKQLRRSVPDRALSPEEVDVVEQALIGWSDKPSALNARAAEAIKTAGAAAPPSERPATPGDRPAGPARGDRPAAPNDRPAARSERPAGPPANRAPNPPSDDDLSEPWGPE